MVSLASGACLETRSCLEAGSLDCSQDLSGGLEPVLCFLAWSMLGSYWAGVIVGLGGDGNDLNNSDINNDISSDGDFGSIIGGASIGLRSGESASNDGLGRLFKFGCTAHETPGCIVYSSSLPLLLVLKRVPVIVPPLHSWCDAAVFTTPILCCSLLLAVTVATLWCLISSGGFWCVLLYGITIWLGCLILFHHPPETKTKNIRKTYTCGIQQVIRLRIDLEDLLILNVQFNLD